MSSFKLVKIEEMRDIHGLNEEERKAVDRVVKSLGYNGGIDDLVHQHGYSSAKDIAEEASFKSVRDYFLGDGWHSRVADFNLNGHYHSQ